MNLNFTKILCAVVVAAFSVSCKTSQHLTYFQNADETSAAAEAADYALKLCPSDELLITVNSLMPEATAAYNLPLVNPAKQGGMAVSATPQNQTYVVDRQGYIEFPSVGKIHVAGMTADGLAAYLTGKIAEEVDEPVVKVMLVNFRVNVLGEVRQPGAVEVKGERFSVLDAIAAAEDLTVYGKRENVLIIREEGGKKQFHRLDLTDASTVNSPYFYLKQNDVVYVEPSKVRAENSEYNQNNSFKISIVSTVVSALSVIASMVIALKVK